MLDAAFARFIGNMLNDGAVNDRQHFLGHRLCGWKETRPKAGNGENGFANRFAHGGIPGRSEGKG
jgi:hypothetical protein